MLMYGESSNPPYHLQSQSECSSIVISQKNVEDRQFTSFILFTDEASLPETALSQ